MPIWDHADLVPGPFGTITDVADFRQSVEKAVLELVCASHGVCLPYYSSNQHEAQVSSHSHSTEEQQLRTLCQNDSAVQVFSLQRTL